MEKFNFQLKPVQNLICFGKYNIAISNVGTTKLNFMAFDSNSNMRVNKSLGDICEEVLGVKFIGNGIFSLKPLRLVISKEYVDLVNVLTDINLRPQNVPDCVNLINVLNNRVQEVLRVKHELEVFKQVEKFNIGEREIAVYNDKDLLFGQRAVISTTLDCVTLVFENKIKGLLALVYYCLQDEIKNNLELSNLGFNDLKFKVDGWVKEINLPFINETEIKVGNVEHLVNKRVTEIQNAWLNNYYFIKSKENSLKYEKIKDIVEKV